VRTVDSALVVVAVAGLAVVSAVDLNRIAAQTLIIYTTPALRDLLEKDLIPRYRASGGLRVEPVYTAAGEQYNRLRMSGNDPEADLFLHASPLYVQRGYEDGYFRPVVLNVTLNETFRGPPAGEGLAWVAFAWTPVVEVYNPRLDAAPDLGSAKLRFGLPHPRLSNNGLYNVLLFELVDVEAGKWALSRTVVQPVNARTSIGGVIDGSFDVTLGYDAVTRQFQKQGAKVVAGPPNFSGRNATTPVLVTAGLVEGAHETEAKRFIDFLFTNATQANLKKFFFRSVMGNESDVDAAFPAAQDVQVVHFDWTNWNQLDKAVPRYEVKSGYN